jgi:hypothetical protein
MLKGGCRQTTRDTDRFLSSADCERRAVERQASGGVRWSQFGSESSVFVDPI